MGKNKCVKGGTNLAQRILDFKSLLQNKSGAEVLGNS